MVGLALSFFMSSSDTSVLLSSIDFRSRSLPQVMSISVPGACNQVMSPHPALYCPRYNNGGFDVEILRVLERYQRLALLDPFQVLEPEVYAFTLHKC